MNIANKFEKHSKLNTTGFINMTKKAIDTLGMAGPKRTIQTPSVPLDDKGGAPSEVYGGDVIVDEKTKIEKRTRKEEDQEDYSYSGAPSQVHAGDVITWDGKIRQRRREKHRRIEYQVRHYDYDKF